VQELSSERSLGLRDGGQEQARVPNVGGTAVAADLILMDLEHIGDGEENRTGVHH
jgi:hypothetical protein